MTEKTNNEKANRARRSARGVVRDRDRNSDLVGVQRRIESEYMQSQLRAYGRVRYPLVANFSHYVDRLGLPLPPRL